MKCDKKAMRLYAVTDRMWLGDRSLAEDVEKALKGGITLLQLREKSMDDAAFLEEAKKIQKLCKAYSVPFIINDNVSVALACNADGVHVGQSDMQARAVREQIGEDKLIGVSVQTVEQAKLAQAQGADYLGVGAVFSTATKKDADAVAYETVKAIAQAVSIPICAIGGINADNIKALSGSGIDGVAIVSAIFGAKDIEKTTKMLKAQSEEMVQAHPAGAGAIFDLDGTLLDSMHVWNHLGEDYLEHHGKKPRKGLDDDLRVLSTPGAAKYFQKEYGITQDTQSIIDEIQGMIHDFYVYEACLKPGVLEMLKAYHEQGIKMCVLTASERPLVEVALERNHALAYFDGILTASELDVCKNNPIAFTKAVAFLGTEPHKTVVFEDTLHAIIAAQQAGFKVVGVYDDSSKHSQSTIMEKSDVYIQNFDELKKAQLYC